MQGQGEAEGAAFPRLALDPDFAAMQLDETARQREDGFRWPAPPALATIRQHCAARVSRWRVVAFLAIYQQRKGEILMKNPLDSLWGTIISGLVLTVILYFVVKSLLGSGI